MRIEHQVLDLEDEVVAEKLAELDPGGWRIVGTHHYQMSKESTPPQDPNVKVILRSSYLVSMTRLILERYVADPNETFLRIGIPYHQGQACGETTTGEATVQGRDVPGYIRSR